MDTNSSDLWTTEAILNTSLNCVTAVVCLLAAIVLVTRLYRKQNPSTTISHYTTLAYRLALYQVLASLALTVVDLVYYLFYQHYNYGEECNLFWLLLYLRWTKLFFVMQLCFNLSILVCCRMNCMNYEKVHVLLALLLPLVAVLPPWISNLSGNHVLGCYLAIENGTQNLSLITEFYLWEVPSMTISLIIAFPLIIALVAKCRLHLRFQYRKISSDDVHYWNAFRELIPLITFPIVYIVFQIVIFSYHFSALINPAVKEPMNISTALFSSCPLVTLSIYLGYMLALREKCQHQVSEYHIKKQRDTTI